MSKIFTVFIKIIISILSSLSVYNYLDVKESYILLVCLLIVIYEWISIFINRIYKKTVNRDYLIIVFSVLYSLSLFVGKSISINFGVYSIVSSTKNIVIFICDVVGLSAILSTLVYTLIYKFKINKKTIEYKKRYFYIVWIVLFLCYLPCYISYYPGILSYDIVPQTKQALGIIAYSQKHPPLHTFCWQMCINIGNAVNFNPLVIYSICQMIIFTYCFAVLFKYLIESKTDKRIVLISLVFVALNPFFALFSFIPTKDVLTGVFFVLSTIRGIQTYKGEDKSTLLGIDILLSCLFRHNVFYAFVLSLLTFVILGSRCLKKIITIMSISLLTCIVINKPIFNYLNIKKDNTRESMSVPIQQISMSVYRHKDEIEQELIDRINDYINIEEIIKNYNPRLSDPMKKIFNVSKYVSDRGDFLTLWLKLFVECPIDYIDAFLNLNLGFWYQDAQIPDIVSTKKFIETHMREIKIDNFDFDRKNLLPNVNKFYERFATDGWYQKIPFIPDIFSLSLPLWLILYVFTKALIKGQNIYIVIIPSLFLWITLMAGPTSISRYVLPIIMMYPLILSILTNDDNI